MKFVEVTAEELVQLRAGLTILERLGREAVKLEVYLFGLTNNIAILDAAKEAIAANAEDEISEDQIQVSEIAVAMPVSSDILYYLTGSGVKLQRGDEFVYLGQGGEGARTLDFGFARINPKATAADFSRLVLSDSNVWLDKFLNQYGTKQPVQVRNEIKRTPGTSTTPQQKMTSLDVEKVVEDFLD